MIDLTGKYAFVTGASSGFGRSIALTLAANGATVKAGARRVEKLVELAAEAANLPGSIEPAYLDITDEKTISDAIGDMEKLHILVANAGNAKIAKVTETTTEMWDEVMNLNGRGTFLTMRAGLDKIVESGGGQAIVITSVAGLYGPKLGAAYAMANHAKAGLVKVCATEYGKRGVTVNGLAPWYGETEITEPAIRGIMRSHSLERSEALARLGRSNPMGELVQCPDIDETILYLVGPGGRMINGQIIEIGGVWTQLI